MEHGDAALRGTVGAAPPRRRTAAWYLKDFRKQLPRQIMAWLGIAFVVIFSYIPIYGVVLAFKDYKIRAGILGSPWVGLVHFEAIFANDMVYTAIGNTIRLSLWSLVFFPLPIVFALLLNELRANRYKKIVQTLSYLPHFVSWVVVIGMLYMFLEKDGILNGLLLSLGWTQQPIFFLSTSRLFTPIYLITNVWKSLGWSSIIYLAAISGISQEMYEAAYIDGAKKLQQVWYITVPSIKQTIAVLFIFAVSGLMNSNFDLAYLLGNDTIRDASETIDTYVFRIGIGKAMYSFASAVGLLKSVIAFALLILADFVSKKLAKTGLF